MLQCYMTKPRDRVLRARVDEDLYLWFVNESKKKKIPYWELLNRMKEIYSKYSQPIPQRTF